MSQVDGHWPVRVLIPIGRGVDAEIAFVVPRPVPNPDPLIRDVASDQDGEVLR
jgi:hypothetical protein